MDMTIKNLFFMLFLIGSSCNLDNQNVRITKYITSEDIVLFTGIGISYRFVIDSLNARFQVNRDSKLCDFYLKNGKLFTTDCNNDGKLEEVHAKKMVRRFLELDLSGITDLNGESEILFVKGDTYHLYSERLPEVALLKTRISSFDSLKMLSKNWYLLSRSTN